METVCATVTRVTRESLSACLSTAIEVSIEKNTVSVSEC